MTLHELTRWLLVVLAGAGLGGLFFGGLWWTVRNALASRQPALWFAGSLLLRLGVVGAGLLLVGIADWRRLVACMAGFVLARLVVTRLIRPAAPDAPRPELPDAP